MSGIKWEPIIGWGEGKIFLTLYEPRWHGFARWRLEQRVPFHNSLIYCLHIKSGWWRPPRTWRCQQFEVTA